jgi:serpin B
MNGLDLSLTNHANATEGVTLNVVNSVWAQYDCPFRVTYLDMLSLYYGAGVNMLDFVTKPDPSRIIINTWVSDQTNDRINDLLPPGSIDTDTRLVLTNAIYFLADWLYKFDPAQTAKKTFNLLNSSTIQADLMMLGKAGDKVKLLYARKPDVRALELPYKGDRLAMLLILPDPGKYSAFESALTVEAISALATALDTEELPPVEIPKFTFTTGSLSLVSALKSLGMVDAFNDAAADFSGISDKMDLVVTDVVHKAFIKVDENGTEAAAATGVVIGVTSMPLDPIEFIADRPFMYCIRDRETNTILFMGRVLDPTKTE